MPGGLLQPVVPGATSIGQVIAQATAAATAQSAQILSAARNIAADRQRAGEMAADAVVRMRLEDFQKEQFRQKKSIEDAQLGIALAANRRAELRAPLELGLLQAEIDQAPLRTALIGAQLTGSQLRNTAIADELAAAPEERILRRRFDEARIGNAELDHKLAQREFDEASIADQDLVVISKLMTETDLTDGESLSYALSMLQAMREEPLSSVFKNPEVANLYNSAVDKIAPTDDARERLEIPEAVIEALRPETTSSMGLRVGTEKRMLIEADKDAKIAQAEAKIKIAKSKKEAFKGQTSKEAKNSIRILDEAIQLAEKEKFDAEEEFRDRLSKLNPGLILPSGDPTPDPALVAPTTQAEVMDYLTRGVN